MASPSVDREQIKRTLQGLFPGDSKIRLRESVMCVHDSFGELPFLSKAVMTVIARAGRYRSGPPVDLNARDEKGQFLPNDYDEWTSYCYAEVNDALGWLSRIQRALIEMGEELRREIVARESRRRAAEEGRAEKEYAISDAAQYELHLHKLGAEGDSDAARAGSTTGGSSGAGEGSGRGESDSGGRGGEDPEAGPPPELHADRLSQPEGPTAKAARILRG